MESFADALLDFIAENDLILNDIHWADHTENALNMWHKEMYEDNKVVASQCVDLTGTITNHSPMDSKLSQK